MYKTWRTRVHNNRIIPFVRDANIPGFDNQPSVYLLRTIVKESPQNTVKKEPSAAEYEILIRWSVNFSRLFEHINRDLEYLPSFRIA